MTFGALTADFKLRTTNTSIKTVGFTYLRQVQNILLWNGPSSQPYGYGTDTVTQATF